MNDSEIVLDRLEELGQLRVEECLNVVKGTSSAPQNDMRYDMLPGLLGLEGRLPSEVYDLAKKFVSTES